ncbi:hypothetical protein [Streptomyces sp. NPDC049970]|uniref:hypothetical protein n=1 Tax=Streptomyces sp. NPDC049970 TaxID=3155033 RepID=UPI003412A7E6
MKAALDVYEAAKRLDAAATADAAVAEADAGQKALDSMTEGDTLEPAEGRRAEVASRLIRQLRTDAERVRKATTAKDVEARKTDLDTAVSEKADADKGVRPARDAYRDCLAKANG